MNVAIIPARKGSKRLPRKNIKHFCGKPIIAYSIEAALKSKIFDMVLVSTDSEEIASIARQYGADTPFIRPSKISDDFSGTSTVIDHAIKWLKNNGNQVNTACCIYATAPFLHPEFLKKGFNLLIDKGCSTVYSVSSYAFPIFRATYIDHKDASLSMFWPEYEQTRSQDLPEAYHDAGQFYWLDVEKFLIEKKIYTNDALPILIPRHLVQDIDNLEDWIRAEYMYKSINLLKGAK
jgi:pseudaminic acid cytidylyltransferase